MNIIIDNLNRYLEDEDFKLELKTANIGIIDDFKYNIENIQKFYDKYYSKKIPKTVICGINPGRFGAGKTGIPFIDFKSLSKLIDCKESEYSENSAGFIFDVIELYGREAFFDNFYLTNFCSIGFIKDSKNFNYYYGLPEMASKTIEKNFIEEMRIVAPSAIISLSVDVQDSVSKLSDFSTLKKDRLPHPSWVTTYRSNDICYWRDKYLGTLKRYS